MRENLGAFKRIIFDQSHILGLTVDRPLFVDLASLGCAAAGCDRVDDTNVNYLAHLPRIDHVSHEVSRHRAGAELILFPPIDQQNARAHQQGCHHNLCCDHLTIYEMAQKNRKDRCEKRKAGHRGRRIGGQQEKP